LDADKEGAFELRRFVGGKYSHQVSGTPKAHKPCTSISVLSLASGAVPGWQGDIAMAAQKGRSGDAMESAAVFALDGDSYAIPCLHDKLLRIRFAAA
jgi:hypothetical protein